MLRSKSFYCIILFIWAFSPLCGLNAFPRNADMGQMPQWMKKLPEPSNGSYHFQIFRAEGPNIYPAMKQLPDIAAYYMERQYDISGVTVETFELRNEYYNGKNNNFQLQKIKDTVYTKAGKVNIRLAIVDVYVSEDGVYFLCTVPDPNSTRVVYDDYELTTQYGIKGLWRSAVIPGWGQLYKGSSLKGGFILGGTAALAGGIIATETIRSDYVRRINETHDVEYKRLYAKRVDQFSTARNICIGAIGALYVYNIIDAIVAPGARRIVVKEKGFAKSDCEFSFYPASPDGLSIAMVFNVTF